MKYPELINFKNYPHKVWVIGCGIGLFCLLTSLSSAGSAQNNYAPDAEFTNLLARDQDDMAIWVHPKDNSKSLIIASDKGANKIFVYDLNGKLLQFLSTPDMPGNIDVRYGFPLGEDWVDIVAVNMRGDVLKNKAKILVYALNPRTRKLKRIDNDQILTGENYGSCLYYRMESNEFYVFTTSKAGSVEQHRLFARGKQVAGKLVRIWDVGYSECCLADDETGVVYVSEEDRALWKFSAEPEEAPQGVAVARVGDASGLEADIEGLAIYRKPGGRGYLLVSNQSKNNFKVYDRKPPHRFRATFGLDSVGDTDGIAFSQINLGLNFPRGIFVAHNGRSAYGGSRMQGVSWKKIAQGEGL